MTIQGMTLLASSATREGIVNLINEFYCSKEGSFELEVVDELPATWRVYRLANDQHQLGTFVRKQKGRWKFFRQGT